MKTYTKQEAVDELIQLGHAFINREGVKAYTNPFGFMGSTYMAKSDPPGSFKGLTLYDGNGNFLEELEGQDTSITATEIANHLGIDFTEMHGRGSQLRSACEAVQKHLQS